MRILNVNSTLGLRLGGGTAERTYQMSRFLAKQANVQCTVLTLDIDLDTERIQGFFPFCHVMLPCFWTRFYLPRAGWRTIKRLVADADVIHLMGHWSALNFLVYLAARRFRKPYVVCPAGSLPIFGRSATLKRIYNFFVGNAIIRGAAACIAVTVSELPHFEMYGVDPSKVVVIPNCVNQADFHLANKPEFLNKYKLSDAPIILFMGRLNPIKGPDLLLLAFIQVTVQLPTFQLVFVGPDGGMLGQLVDTAERSGLSERVHFLGYLSGIDKSAAYQSANLLVVPSRQEAMSMVAIEAGICGTPVLLTDQCGFSGIRDVDPRLEVPATVDDIAQGLIQLLVKAEILTTIGPMWNNYVMQQFTWDAIGPSYLALYTRIGVKGGNS
jgi:glycosyltransferase involved in cell wall biosynthesis